MKNLSQNKSADELLNDCLTLNDLHDAFTLRELVILTQDGLLENWLKKHFFESQAEMLSEVRNLNSNSVLLTLCNALNVDVTKLSDYEAYQVIQALQSERESKERERECGKDGKIVTNQEELVEVLADENIHKVYLYDEIFSIPLNRKRITYDGRNNALINILAQGDTILDFDSNEIYFYNLTIVFHFLKPNQVKLDHSGKNHNHVIFLCDHRIVQDDSVRPQELANFLAGRDPFESADNFAERAKFFHNVIVGKAYLNATDYNLWHETFFLNPVWKVEFIESLRRYVRSARLVFPISPGEAKEIFERERAQLIYADFGTAKDDAVIVRLYLHSNGGRGKIYPIYRLGQTTSQNFGSGSGNGGYGLDLIAVDYYD